MAEKLNKKVIVSIGGAVFLIAAIGAMYIVFLRPKMTEWTTANREKKNRQKELTRLRSVFDNGQKPKTKLHALQAELKEIEKANKALGKIKRAGMELVDIPPELKDPDPNIRKVLFDEYNAKFMKDQQGSIEAALDKAEIDPPDDFSLFTPLRGTEELPYYINRTTGLQGITSALIKTQEASDEKIIFEKLGLEHYAGGEKRRQGSLNVLSYLLELTMDMDNLISFLYNLNEEEGYYYVDNMTIKPATRGRFGGQDVKLLVDARINTIMIYKSEVMKDLKRAAEQSAIQTRRRTTGGKVGGFLALAAGSQKAADKEVERQQNKKWYEFWK
jgi:hypothetical protein